MLKIWNLLSDLCQNIEESDRMVGEAAEGLIPMDNLHPARDRASGGNGRNEPGNDRLQKFFRENRSASVKFALNPSI